MKLTVKQKKKIVAAYVSQKKTQQELADEYNVSVKTISRLIKNDPEMSEKCLAIKKKAEEEASEALVKAITDRRKFAEELIDDILQSVKEKVKDAPLRDLMGAAKILSENFVGANSSAAPEDDKTFTVVICDNGQTD